ncbi:subtilisin-like protease SBT5.3 [Humulus lupulus]|uniref:subtilisin-like protease SBT5.3 n=1 Tax=Humulus lupulus TaxID=3486 RepID=UPI002B4140B5|nr:subtilisin-like protease SBT5.3 [Humulus lupulus]
MILPKGVLQKINAICRAFLWKVKSKFLGPGLVGWETLCKSKKEGGLGFRNVLEWNKEAIGKYIWAVATKQDNLWIKWVHHVYLGTADWWSYEAPSASSWYWKQIVNVKNSFKQLVDTQEFQSEAYQIKKGYRFLCPIQSKVIWHHLVWDNTAPYIVYMGTHSHGLNPSSDDLERATNSHHNLLGSYLGSEEKAKDAIFYSYNKYINGFAAILDEAEAAEIQKHPDVVSIFLSKGVKLHTTRSWEFLRLEGNDEVVASQSIWTKARFGEDVIIGNLDGGVWPESKSFSEYEGIGPIPSKWRGSCQPVIDDKIHCNRKLIGAKYFNKGYLAYLKTVNASTLNKNFFTSRDDYNGHGTHTLSTAGGSFVPGANIFGNANGTAKGGSPKARVAAYKVCWTPINGIPCVDADIMAGFDEAISDGVDVLSISLGGAPQEFFEDAISIGGFHAIMNNIVVVVSAGNNGPDPETVSKVSPWLLTVAASTIDRDFNSYVTLGNKKQLKGSSLSSSSLPSKKFYPLISGSKAAKVDPLSAQKCLPKSLDPKKVKGKILICYVGDGSSPLEKGHQAFIAGAVGVVLINDILLNDNDPDPHLLPSSHLNGTQGKFVYEYLNSTRNPKAYITRAKTEVEVKPSPIMASFSSRGPNVIEPALLKPDVTAPGVNILAAFPEAFGPSDQLPFDKRRVPFNIMSGTSMACPHVSGIVGLLKTLHPNWSPAIIHSAIMTTARIQDSNKGPLLDWNRKKATPFQYGSGHIQPNRAMDPGLVYDTTIDDYLNFLCAHGYDETMLKTFTKKPYKCPTSFNMANFNYPSIVITNLSSPSVIVTRIIKNVGAPGTYKAYVRAPIGVSIYVKPTSLTFGKIGEEKKFEIILKPKVAKKTENYVFGQLKWSDGKHYVRSPIVVKY